MTTILGQDAGNPMNRKRKQPRAVEPDTWTRYAPLAVCVFLFVAVAIVFGQTIDFGFVNYDDTDYVYENFHVRQGLTPESIAWAMTTGHALNWHPVTWLSHELDCQFYGLRAGGHHATSVLLHAATAILLFLVLRRMTGDLWPSAFVAAVFAIHPLRVESVAWVAERKDVLSGLFFMLTLAAYLNYVRHPFSRTRYLIVLVVFALGLMSKPMLVTMPFVLLLLDYWPLGRMTPPARDCPNSCVSENGTVPSIAAIFRRLIAEKIPLLLLSAVSCVVTSQVQVEAIARTDRLALAARVDNALVSYVAYLGQSLWPADLALLYPHPGTGLPGWKVAASLLVLVGISAGVLAFRRRIPCLTVGWLWYLGMLVPVIGLVQVGSQGQADRYTYLPQIGLLIGLAWGAMYAARSWPYRRWAFGVASALAVAVLMGCAWRQTTYWRNSQTLWNRTLACNSENRIAHSNLGVYLTQVDQLDDAVRHLQIALNIEPSYLAARVNLGKALAKLGQIDDATAQYREALKIDPNCVEAHSNLGAALSTLGQFDQAVWHLQKALDIQPSNLAARINLGAAFAKSGRIDDAITQYREVLMIDPSCVEAHYNLGMAWARQNRLDEAIPEYEQTLKIDPDCAEAHANLGVALQLRGRIGDAAAHFQKALVLATQQNKQQLAENLKARLRQIAE